MSAEAANAAFQRFVEALNRSRDEALLRAAVTDAVQVDRYAPGARGVAPVAETFIGIAEVTRWLVRMPPVITFALTRGAWPDGDGGWVIEYAYHVGEFHNGGLWIARLAEDGRIATLSHHPSSLSFPLSFPPHDPH